ncbi:MAG: TonB-dependent receptor [Opitutae bacterium]|nr:TonB-dependent receptor [Opitutae bacterium]
MKTHFHFLSLTLLLGARVLGATETTPDSGAEKIIKLDTVIVSAGPDAKSAFDLAQGTSILIGDELRRREQATLGETLAAMPGINSTYYGPGASRPVIRGLGGDRVRVLTNSIGALDASNISPDHNAAIEPLFASRIEVLRGPATLLYGSSAVGGVVNVIDNSIPDTAADGQAHGALELRGFGPADERAGVLSVGGGNAGFAFHVNGLRQQTGDTRIPGVARIDAGAPADQPRGTLPSSAIDTKSGSLGATGFWSAGRLGVALSKYDTDYGVPTGDDPPTSISLRQSRFDLAGEISRPFGVFRGLHAKFGYGDYRHSELSGGTVVNTTFHNRAWEGRLELPVQPIGDLSGTVGLQAARSNFSAVGAEVVTPPYVTTNGAVFLLEELKRGPVTWQVGARYEAQSVTLGAVDPALPALPGLAAATGEKKTFGGLSASGGFVWYPAKDYSVGVSLAYSERLPTAQELFSNGPHGGTGAYEFGTSGLRNEKSTGLDVSLRKRAGFVTGSLSFFVNRFSGYIFEQQLPPDAVPVENNPDGLTPYQFIAKDARFYGGEADVELHLWDRGNRHLHLDLMADYVHAQQATDDEPLPRIPPMRYGAGLRYEDSRWRAGVELRHAARQNRFSSTENSTAGYALLNADVSFLVNPGDATWELFLRGNNLTNATARASTSFLKDFAPLPGRGVLAGVRMLF